MAVSQADMNQIRVNVLGTTVDAPGAAWTTMPPGAANTLQGDERIINRAINLLRSQVANALLGTNGFAARFNQVIGDEATADQAAWDAIGENLIQAVAALKAGGGGGGGGVTIGTGTNPTPPATATEGSMWFRMEDGKLFLFGEGAWFQLI